MKSLTCLFILFSACIFSEEELSLKEKLKKKIIDCEIAQSKLTPMLTLDCYTYYYLEGVKNAYHECLRIIAKDDQNE